VLVWQYAFAQAGSAIFAAARAARGAQGPKLVNIRLVGVLCSIVSDFKLRTCLHESCIQNLCYSVLGYGEVLEGNLQVLLQVASQDSEVPGRQEPLACQDCRLKC
jgi:hypothetical protein